MKLFPCLLRAAMIIATAWLAAGCVHEFPETDEPSGPVTRREFRLILNYDEALPLLGEYDYADGAVTDIMLSRAHKAPGPEEARKRHQIRHVVNVYPAISSRGEYSRTSDFSFVFTRETGHGLNDTLTFDLPKGDYRIIVWTDYVDHASREDKYYDTRDFAEILLPDNGIHYGSNDWRDAFYGSTETVVSREGRAETRVELGEAKIEMRRPMARYTFVSTDLARFLESRSRQGETRRVSALDEYVVRFVYPRYMPCSFNAFTGKPADSRSGVTYESEIQRINDDEAEIGFDYIFVNGERTATTVGLEIYSRDGALLARIPPFDVPLERSRHTIVRGEFLTTKSGGALGVDPAYKGSFNIEIN